MKMDYISIKPHLPIIISLSAFFLIMFTLFIRKWFLNKIKGLTKLIEERTDTINTISKFWVSKHDEQFNIFAKILINYQNGIGFINIPKAKVTQAERELFKRLVKYESEKFEEILKLLDMDFVSNQNEIEQKKANP